MSLIGEGAMLSKVTIKELLEPDCDVEALIRREFTKEVAERLIAELKEDERIFLYGDGKKTKLPIGFLKAFEDR